MAKETVRVLILTLAAVVILLSTFNLSSGREVPFTQEDRDRLIRLEEGLKAINQRIEDTNKRIDNLQTFMLWGFGILFG
ncbi:MAG: hypothetical protein ACK415_12170, partial [Thermodesulfovibrionales bacterium]